MRLGLGARLAIAFALLAAVTALVTAGVSAYSTGRGVNRDIDRFLEARAADIVEGRRFGRGGRNDTDGGTQQRSPVAESLVEADAEVQILDRNADVLISSGAELPLLAADRELLDRRKPPRLRTVEIDGEQFRMITRHMDGGGVVQVAQSTRTANQLVGELRAELVVVGVAMSALAGLTGWLVANRTTKPLRRLTRSVETIVETEDLSTRVALDRRDEIGRLSAEFDALLQTLQASRLQQQQLVHDAAHELRTPLTSVRANVDFLGRALDLDAETRQATVNSIKSELAELSELLGEVVELAAEGPGNMKFEELDLAVVTEGALAQFELRSSRPVERDLTATMIRGERAALVRAARNLIGNADKYSPQGLAISVTVRDGALWVRDHGPGVHPDERDRVFDRFYRSEQARSAPGSGLGLAIVAKAVTEHLGRVWVRDAPGGGAEIGFTLPTVKG